jgi:hypothetical protein
MPRKLDPQPLFIGPPFPYHPAIDRQRKTPMRRFRQSRDLFQFLTGLMALVFMCAGPVAAYSAARVMPSGKVSVFREGQLVQELREEAPLPDGALLRTEGHCGVRLEDFYLVAADGSAFGLTRAGAVRELRLEQGTVYFALASLPVPLTFRTPEGLVTAQQIQLQASASGGLLKGYLAVTANGAEIGVLEGGAMVVSTAQGEQVIQPGQRILLAQADLIDTQPAANETPEEAAAAEEEDDDDKIPATYYWVGGGLLAAGAGVALAGGGGGGGGGGGSPSVSPSSP